MTRSKLALIACVTLLMPVVSWGQSSARVVVERANVRAEPSTQSAVVTVVSRDNEVTVVERQGQWARVSYRSRTGWMRLSMLTIQPQPAAVAASPPPPQPAPASPEPQPVTVPVRASNEPPRVVRATAESDRGADPSPRDGATSARSEQRFALGDWYVGPRAWGTGGYGTGLGMQIERAWRPFGDGDSMLGVGAGVDRFSPAAGISDVRILVFSGFVNLHFAIDDQPSLDPFVGVGMGWINASSDLAEYSNYYNAGFLLNPRLGVRWFATPRLALQVDGGYGIGYLGLGAAVRF